MGKIMLKKEFINRFLHDQHENRMVNGFYNTIKSSSGKVIFTDAQLINIKERYQKGESMTSIGKSYRCSRQTIRENLKEIGVY